jgi:hypothetical protein
MATGKSVGMGVGPSGRVFGFPQATKMINVSIMMNARNLLLDGIALVSSSLLVSIYTVLHFWISSLNGTNKISVIRQDGEQN